MPIRAENKDRYPKNWREIADWIKFTRGEGRCECLGECGRPAHHLADDGRCRNRHGEPRYGGRSGQPPVMLTCAHLDHTPENVDPANLRGYCEGCHLHYDRAHHAETARRTREAALGMEGLFDILS